MGDKAGLLQFDNDYEQGNKYLRYGQEINYMQYVDERWEKQFLDDYFKDVTRNDLKILRVRIYTTVGQTIDVKPGPGFLKLICEKKAIKPFKTKFRLRFKKR